jgi:nicotinamide mononucleotide transporter
MLDAITTVSNLEWVAVVAGLIYVILAARSNIWCWPAAFIGTGASVVLLWNVSLLMDSALNGFYLAMAVYGFWQWQYGGVQGSPLRIRSWRVSQHVAAVCAIVLLSFGVGFWLDNSTSAAWPYLDSATTVSAVIATFMVARKILENWLYWIVIDVVSVWIYWERELYLYAVLFILYSVIAVFGFVLWQRQQTQEQGATN